MAKQSCVCSRHADTCREPSYRSTRSDSPAVDGGTRVQSVVRSDPERIIKHNGYASFINHNKHKTIFLNSINCLVSAMGAMFSVRWD
jgi:hypothetical protein